jgi:hypothetical protein
LRVHGTEVDGGSEYRIYWGAWDYPTQFPDGINFVVGKSNELTDWVCRDARKDCPMAN